MDLVGGESTLVSVECGLGNHEVDCLFCDSEHTRGKHPNDFADHPSGKTRRCVRSEFSTTLRDLNVTQVLEKTLWAVRNDTFACIEDTWYRVLPFRPVSTPLHCLQNSIP